MPFHELSARIRFREVPIEEVQLLEFRNAYEAWDALPKSSQACPQWPGIEFILRLPPSLAADTMVMSYSGDLAKAKYVYWGSGLRWSSPFDMTGKNPFEYTSPDLRQFIEHTLYPVIDAKAPRFYYAEFTGAAGVRYPEHVLRLPFFGENNDLAYILTIISIMDRREMSKIFDNMI